MNVNVIGGSGFIGTRLIKRLMRRTNIRVQVIDKKLNNTFPELVQISDVRSLSDLRKQILEDSIIINLAAEHRDDVRPLSLYDEVNIDGARNICIVAREKNIKTIIFTSSVAVYGFAPINTDETGQIAPFNAYGRTKFEAEQIFKEWQAESPSERKLIIIRPSVVFGEQNRGNVYNLLRQIASRKFIMIGHGQNKKSMVYVENLAAFIEFSMNFNSGLHIYNFVDKPDFTMNHLVQHVNKALGQTKKMGVRLPFFAGYGIGKMFDIMAFITKKRFPISSIRIKKFCSNSVFNTAVHATGFVAPISLEKALEQTIQYEFLQSNVNEDVFYTE